MKFNENACNEVTVIGDITNPTIQYSHTSHDKKFYMTTISAHRTSGTADDIPVMLTKELADVITKSDGFVFKITGQLRSFNEKIDDDSKKKSKLILQLFAKSVEQVDDDTGMLNDIELNAFICKDPIVRATPFKRTIADLLLAVPRPFSTKTDYIPAIAWGNVAKFIKDNVHFRNKVKIHGRIQSREYKKVIGSNTIVKTTYEVSIDNIQLIEADDIIMNTVD